MKNITKKVSITLSRCKNIQRKIVGQPLENSRFLVKFQKIYFQTSVQIFLETSFQILESLFFNGHFMAKPTAHIPLAASSSSLQLFSFCFGSFPTHPFSTHHLYFVPLWDSAKRVVKRALKQFETSKI